MRSNTFTPTRAYRPHPTAARALITSTFGWWLNWRLRAIDGHSSPDVTSALKSDTRVAPRAFLDDRTRGESEGRHHGRTRGPRSVADAFRGGRALPREPEDRDSLGAFGEDHRDPHPRRP